MTTGYQPLVGDFEVGLDLICALGHTVHETCADRLIDTLSEERDLAVRLFLKLLLQRHETSALIHHLHDRVSVSNGSDTTR